MSRNKNRKRGGFPPADAPKPNLHDPTARPFRWDLVIIFLTIAIGGTYLAIWLRPGMTAEEFMFEVTKEYPHDATAFTQGLYLEGDILWESTGRYGESTIRKTDLKTGEIIQSEKVPDKYFAEGMTIWKDQVIQLTWKAGVAIIYDRDLKKVKEVSYKGEGWGLTHNDEHLIISHGTAIIHFLDPVTFEEVRSIRVTNKGRAVGQLNELEYVNDLIYANKWQTNEIYEINPANGNVRAVIYLKGLWPSSERASSDCLLNGITFDPKTRRLLVTGKLCPKVWEIELRLKK